MKTITKYQIKEYLQEHIKRSIINEVGTAIEIFPRYFTKETGAFGFFAVPRMLFPEIDGLGSYITGRPEETTKNISAFIEKIMSQVEKKYKGNGGFIAKVYRHGLLHQHTPKIALYKGFILGWRFSFHNKNAAAEIREKDHIIWKGRNLEFNIRQFYEDTLKAIDIFIPLAQTIYKKTFIKSYIKQNEPKLVYSTDCTFLI